MQCLGCFDGARKTLSKAKTVAGHFVDLNDDEIRAVHLTSGGTATVYKGLCPQSWLRARVAKIVRANPWLAGRLCSNPSTGKLGLWVPEEIDWEGFLEVVPVADQLYDVLGKRTPSAWTKHGSAVIDRNEPIPGAWAFGVCSFQCRMR